MLVNRSARAGRAARSVDAVLAGLGQSGHEVRVLAATSRDEARSEVARVVAGGAHRLVVAGGDGLVHDALQAVAGTRTVLGVVPVGSGNDFARALGLEGLDTAAACRAALGPPRALDALHSGAGWVASIATIGFSAGVTARAERLRFPRGGSRYTLATLLELPGLRPVPLRIVVDDEAHEVDAVLVAVANTAYFGGGMAICPDAVATDGRLDVGVVGPIGRVRLLRFFPQVFDGHHRDHPAFTAWQGGSVRIEPVDADAEPLDVWADGERMGTTPFELRAVRAAVLVAAPSA